MKEHIEKEFNPCNVCEDRQCSNCTLHRLAGEMVKRCTSNVVERKRGEWIWDDNAYDWGLGAWVCKECHSRNDNIPAKKDTNPYVWVGSKYCPNCGADMREVPDGR